ncbi:7TM GPCR domain containing protein [Aphelenchoides besseyi]|nr:7TM GPCR domain containing protein [Aphelenchoides besseyi]KAI6211075.1 7TM GPCR domain containing protein [Aphelenchoides besseyi]
MLPDPNSCQEAEHLGRNWVLNSVLFVHLVLSVIAIVLIIHLAFVSHALDKFFALIHRNLKVSCLVVVIIEPFQVLFVYGGFIFIVHSLLITILRGISLVSAIRPDFHDCNFQWKHSIDCLALKSPIYFCVFSFSAIHFSVFVERSVATFGYRFYASRGFGVGVVLLVFVILTASSLVYYVYHTENLSHPRAYCLSTTRHSSRLLQNLMVFAAILDICATIGDFAIRKANKKLRRSVRLEYSLGKSYQIRENQVSLNFIFPLSVIHSCFFLTYLIASIFLRSKVVVLDPLSHVVIIELLQTAVCFYVLIMLTSMIILWNRIMAGEPNWLEPHHTHRENEADYYFQQLQLQIGNTTSGPPTQTAKESTETNTNLIPRSSRFWCLKSERALSIKPTDS